MNEYALLTVYSLLVLLSSLLGGSVPLLGKVTHNRLQLYLSLSAGVMIGAAFFHVMPDAIKMSGDTFGWWMSLAVVGLLFIERFIAPHSHEVGGSNHHVHDETHSSGTHKAEAATGHEHSRNAQSSERSALVSRDAQSSERSALVSRDAQSSERSALVSHHSDAPEEHRAAAPAVAGWMAVLGLTIHTFMNGFGLGGAVLGSADSHEGLPAGFALFLAIILHKPADALAISTVLSRKRTARRKLVLVQFGFALMVPVGVMAFALAHGMVEHERMASALNELTGAALAFSAGTFLFIALSDLLPEVQFHRHDRIPLFLALVLGVAFMGAIAYLEPH